MRTLRLSLAGTVILALLGGLGGAAVAQDAEDERTSATHVTGQSIEHRTISEGVMSPDVVYGFDQVRDAAFEHDIEWSDPRLPSLMRITENRDEHWMEDFLAVAISVNIRLESPVGAWTGTERVMVHGWGTGESVTPGLTLLTGEGEYEGLWAMLQKTWHEDDTTYDRPTWEGFIFEGDLTPMPDPPEPPTE